MNYQLPAFLLTVQFVLALVVILALTLLLACRRAVAQASGLRRSRHAPGLSNPAAPAPSDLTPNSLATKKA